MGYIEAIAAKGWQIFDVTNESPGDPNNWERRNHRSPASAVRQGRTYLFTPRPEPNQTVWDAYLAVGGVGACLRVDAPPPPEYSYLLLRYAPSIAVFSRMMVHATGVMMSTPPSIEVPECDIVVLDPARAEETFVRDFDIITIAEVEQAALEYRQRPNAT